MSLFRCNVCSAYDYDQDNGDPKTGIEPGTHPQDFPDDWACPICGSDKTHLDPL
jgi:rubredoxin